eukprot:5359795-Alexandrium_andersonii.AAC.1
MKRLGVDLSPKHHLWIHLTKRVLVFGNPRTYSTFVDETLNLTIAGMTAASHAAHWETRVIDRSRLLAVRSIRGEHARYLAAI